MVHDAPHIEGSSWTCASAETLSSRTVAGVMDAGLLDPDIIARVALQAHLSNKS